MKDSIRLQLMIHDDQHASATDSQRLVLQARFEQQQVNFDTRRAALEAEIVNKDAQLWSAACAPEAAAAQRHNFLPVQEVRALPCDFS